MAAVTTHNFHGLISAMDAAPAGGFAGDGSRITGIVRSNIAVGTSDYVLINGGGGLITEEQYLAVARGGLGASWSAVVGTVAATRADGILVGIAGGTTGVFSTSAFGVTKSDATAFANTVVMRDASGDIWANSVHASNISTDVSDPVHGLYVYTRSGYAETTNVQTVTLLDIPLPDAGFNISMSCVGVITFTTSTATAAGCINLEFMATCSSLDVIAPSVMLKDSRSYTGVAINACSVTAVDGGSRILRLRAVAAAGTAVKVQWGATLQVTIRRAIP